MVLSLLSKHSKSLKRTLLDAGHFRTLPGGPEDASRVCVDRPHFCTDRWSVVGGGRAFTPGVGPGQASGSSKRVCHCLKLAKLSKESNDGFTERHCGFQYTYD